MQGRNLRTHLLALQVELKYQDNIIMMHKMQADSDTIAELLVIVAVVVVVVGVCVGSLVGPSKSAYFYFCTVERELLAKLDMNRQMGAYGERFSVRDDGHTTFLAVLRPGAQTEYALLPKLFPREQKETLFR